ncbi:hypothetical protein [Sulfobacillus harzensis]|uniref:Uncharacterized protein n=1 Tax=Sulfobacillus harzensis TaxID=2729629 RepID=A0A7Y0L317_9FIRM|nr:hypothetical protein [Sulfobacillus harzensis]NMP22168.1 hypothetical protein [Sulfobacillus harzensis]
MRVRTIALAALPVVLLSGCGWFTPPDTLATTTPSREPLRHTVLVPQVKWYPVSVGDPVLLAEGAQISSVLMGPQNRIYYGTTNPFGNADVLGWINPSTLRNQWVSVPSANPPFPPNSGLNNLSPEESASWGGVSLIVSGSHNVWYRTWGYVGAWSADTGRFVPGGYNVPGPTVTNGTWTASVASNFVGQSHLTLMNVRTRKTSTITLPDNAEPVAVSLTSGSGQAQPTVWLETNQSLLKVRPGTHTLTPVATLPTTDFFVAMGLWGSSVWTVDADGNIARAAEGQLKPIATVNISPLNAVSAPNGGLWMISPHHLALWEPHQRLRTWAEPQSAYTDPATSWPISGSNEPPNWPPSPHLSGGTALSAIVGDGTWIGIGQFVKKTVIDK